MGHPMLNLLAQLIIRLGMVTLPLAPQAPPLVSLDAIVAHPGDYLGQTLRTHVQVHSEQPAWNSYLTRFGPGAYRCFRVWSDQQILWKASDYGAPLTRLFLNRRLQRQFSRAKVQERYLCTVVVREWFAGQPWIEVQRAIRTRKHVPEGAILAAIRASDFVERGAFALALGEFDRALLAPLPPNAARQLTQARDACARRAALGEVRPVEASTDRQ